MVTPELLNFIKQKLAQGANAEEIRAELLGNGWQEADISEGFGAVQASGLSSPSQISALRFFNNRKVLFGIIAAIIILGAAYGIYALVAKPKNSQPPLPNTNQSQQNSPPANTAPAQNSSSSKPAATTDPGEVYLAYKKDLYTKTETGPEIMSLYRKYRPANIVQQWDQQGGADKVFPTSKESCVLLRPLRLINPDPTIIRVDSAKINPASADLQVSASGGYKGTVQMIRESDGWKVDQESWPTWPFDPMKLVNPPCQ